MERVSMFERVCCEWWADGCLLPACDKEVKNHRKASIIQSENSPCGWPHGPRTHSRPFTTAVLLKAPKFHSLFSFSTAPLAPSSPISLAAEKSLHNAAVKAEVDSSAPLWTVHMWTTFTGCLSTSLLINASS